MSSVWVSFSGSHFGAPVLCSFCLRIGVGGGESGGFAAAEIDGGDGGRGLFIAVAC